MTKNKIFIAAMIVTKNIIKQTYLWILYLKIIIFLIPLVSTRFVKNLLFFIYFI
jgi:hypothetical protein